MSQDLEKIDDFNPLKVNFDNFLRYFDDFILPNWKKGFLKFDSTNQVADQMDNYQKPLFIRDPIWGEIGKTWFRFQ